MFCGYDAIITVYGGKSSIEETIRRYSLHLVIRYMYMYISVGHFIAAILSSNIVLF